MIRFATSLKSNPEDHVPENLRELRMRQRESPQAQVGGRVGDCPQHKLNGVDPYTISLEIGYIKALSFRI